MCHSAIFLSVLLLFARINADSTEEQGFTNFYVPSTVDFHDIYSSSLALLSEDQPITPTVKEEDFHISNMPSQFVEFRQPRSTTQPPTSTTEITTSFESAENSTDSSTKSSVSTTTTEESEDSAVKVLPIKKNFQRGVLDLLFPAARVRTFKSIFDTFKKILSHTFRR